MLSVAAGAVAAAAAAAALALAVMLSSIHRHDIAATTIRETILVSPTQYLL